MPEIPSNLGGFEWAGQNFIVSNVVMEEGKYYQFTCDIEASATEPITLKLALWNGTGDADEVFYDNDVQVTGGTKLSYKKEYLPAKINGTFPVVLIVDLGRCAGSSSITISNISLKSN